MKNVDITEHTPVILSLCSGFGGIERGIERAIGKLKVAAYVEIEAFIIENLLSLMEQGVLDSAPVWSDLKTFNAKPFRERIHGITGGYPCQPFSNAGNRKGTEDPRHLWPHIQRIVSTVNPVWCFFENVSGHLTLGFEDVYTSLVDMGYKVEAGIFTAEEVGAPHQRERLFILAVKAELADSYSHGHGAGCGGIQDKSSAIKGEAQRQYRQRSRNESWNECKELGHSDSVRCERCIWIESEKIRGEGYTCKGSWVDRADSEERWPAKQGQYQHDWEEPRTVKPGMGYTINGYNYRKDLLRMYGNGVVEQTAEIAWIELWNKINY